MFQDTRGSQKQERNAKVYDTHLNHGYTWKEIADSLGLHYSTIRKTVQRVVEKSDFSRPLFYVSITFFPDPAG